MARKRSASAANAPADKSAKAKKEDTGLPAQGSSDPANGVAPKPAAQPSGKKAAKPAKATTPKAAKAPSPAKLSALDAAVKVLEEAGTPLTCQEMIAAMAAKG